MVDSRDATVDTLRGLAIITMVAANLAGPVLAVPHPFWLRLYGSFAAPLFVLLSGMMVVVTTARGRSLMYFCARGASVLLVAAVVDAAIWQIVPFTSMDVLYVIALCIPLCALVLRLPAAARWAVAVLIFAATPALQSALGYTAYPTEMFLDGTPTVVVDEQTPIVNHWLVDGFFPIFPWAGFAVLGVALAVGPWRREGLPLGSLGVLVVSCAVWWRWPGPLLVRGGYSELFYPATVGYVATAVGVIGVLFWAVDRRRSLYGADPLRALGESSLAMYLLHLLVIRYAIKPLWPPRVELPAFLVLYAGLVGALIAAAYGFRALKRRLHPRALMARVILGS